MKSQGKNKPAGPWRRAADGLVRFGKMLVPNRYVAVIYLMFIIPAVIYLWQPVSPSLDGAASDYPERDLVSFDPHNGYTYGDIVRIGGPDGQGAGAAYRGHRYKVRVVYTVSHRSAPRAFAVTEVTRDGGGSHPSANSHYTHITTKPGRITEGPAIVCVGHNAYGFIAAPYVERGGFLNLGRTERNRIYKLTDVGADLDISLYSMDCEPPGAAVIERARSQFHVALPPSGPLAYPPS